VPIEIRELHIRVSVSGAEPGHPAGAAAPAPGAEGDAKQAMVAECVEQVMDLLRDRKER
jgi:hypothetical protein